ncbi:hypothetical protein HMPREF9238_01567, partial [Gleimia europaea ACS-120-V-Col10b]
MPHRIREGKWRIRPRFRRFGSESTEERVFHSYEPPLDAANAFWDRKPNKPDTSEETKRNSLSPPPP